MTVEVTPVETPPETPSVPEVVDVSDAPLGDTPAETPAAAADPASETPDEGGQPGRRNRAQERIEELAQTNKYLREHNEFLREHIAKTVKVDAPAPVVTPPVEDIPEVMPTLESCGFDTAKHAEETAKWVKAQVARGVADGLSAKDAKVEAQSQEQIVIEAANVFRKEYADFDLLISNPALTWTPAILSALNAAGADSPGLGYHLAQNPDKLAKIGRMKPEQQLMQLGAIQAQLAAAPKAPKAPIPPAVIPSKAPVKKPASTNAPPPPTPVSGAASPDIDPMTLSGVEWAKLRRQEVAERRAGKSKTVSSY